TLFDRSMEKSKESFSECKVQPPARQPKTLGPSRTSESTNQPETVNETTVQILEAVQSLYEFPHESNHAGVQESNSYRLVDSVDSQKPYEVPRSPSAIFASRFRSLQEYHHRYSLVQCELSGQYSLFPFHHPSLFQ